MKTAEDILKMKGAEKIAILTAYGYSTASCMDGLVDAILVGDSLGMVVLGFESTRDVTMQDMLRHTAAVARGAKKTFIIADMPFRSYDRIPKAVRNARSLLSSGAHAVKIEGSHSLIVHALRRKNIPVMGHVGLLPQTAPRYAVQGRDEKSAEKIFRDAKDLQKAGCFAVVLECIPAVLADRITKSISIPTIGIGSGALCDGQVLVTNDMLGLYPRMQPRFVKQYANLCGTMKQAFSEYCKEVKSGKFPGEEHSFL